MALGDLASTRLNKRKKIKREVKMKSKILALGLVCLLIIFLVYCKKGTPTTPEPPKPQATYTGVMSASGLHYTYLDLIQVTWEYSITNTNNVGATIIKVEYRLRNEGQDVWTNTYWPTETERIGANLTYNWTDFATMILTYRPAKAKVLVYVHDDNGYDQTITGDPVWIDWLIIY